MCLYPEQMQARQNRSCQLRSPFVRLVNLLAPVANASTVIFSVMYAFSASIRQLTLNIWCYLVLGAKRL